MRIYERDIFTWCFFSYCRIVLLDIKYGKYILSCRNSGFLTFLTDSLQMQSSYFASYNLDSFKSFLEFLNFLRYFV